MTIDGYGTDGYSAGAVKDAAGRAATGRYAFHVFLQHKALSDRRRDDAIPEPLGQLSQRPPAGAVRRGDQLEVEGLEGVDGLRNDRLGRASQVEAAQDAKEGDAGKPLRRVRENIDQAGVRTGREDEQALVRQVDGDEPSHPPGAHRGSTR